MMDLVVRHRVERSCYMIDWGEAASRCSQPATCGGMTSDVPTARFLEGALFRLGPIAQGQGSPIRPNGGVAQAD